MSNENAACLPGTGRWAWPRAIAIGIVVVALATVGATGAHAIMGQNSITENVTITETEDELITRFCELGDACSDEGALSGPFEGVWRDEPLVEPGNRTFLNIRLEKVLSTADFDIYCAAGGGVEGCARIEPGGEGVDGEWCGPAPQALEVVNPPDTPDTCPAGFDYKIEYTKTSPVTLTVCSLSDAVASCLEPDDELVENGEITAFRAGFDYDCTRYCYGGCCRR